MEVPVSRKERRVRSNLYLRACSDNFAQGATAMYQCTSKNKKPPAFADDLKTLPNFVRQAGEGARSTRTFISSFRRAGRLRSSPRPPGGNTACSLRGRLR